MFSRRIRLMAELLRENRRPIWTSMFSTILTVFIGFATPMLLAETIDAVIGEKPLHAPAFMVAWFERIGGRAFVVENLWIVAGILVLLSLFNGVFQYVKGRASAQASETVALTLRERLYGHLQRMTYGEHVKAETGDLIQRCTSDVDTVRRFLAMQLTEIVNAVIMIVLAAALLLQRHVTLTLLSFVLMPIQLVFALVFFQRVSKHFRIMDEAEGRMSAVLQENLTAVRVVRAFGRQQYEVEKFDGVSRDFRDKANRLMRHFATYWSVSDLISFLQSGITLLFGAWYASQGVLTVGTLTLFLGYVNMMLWPIRRLGRIL
ncbi:MAG TPA: ABC transporter ATP-binding protein, partial [Clostridia bacterium]|nr:ABC transporter ATP-binding protein [Clostridia bacterium]